MIRDITIGQYYPADSVLHKMDPRAKLVGTLVFIISVFVFHTFPICSGNYISGSDDRSFQSSCEIYVQGTEGNRDASYDHSGI